MIGNPKPSTVERNKLWVRQLERLLRLERDYKDELNYAGARLIARAITTRERDLRREGGAASIRAKVLMDQYRGYRV